MTADTRKSGRQEGGLVDEGEMVQGSESKERVDGEVKEKNGESPSVEDAERGLACRHTLRRH